MLAGIQIPFAVLQTVSFVDCKRLLILARLAFGGLSICRSYSVYYETPRSLACAVVMSTQLLAASLTCL